MDKDLLRKVQIKQLEILDAIHNICVENHLRYYLIGGSCLGAVRHKGFIPWDVDIDIAMPREDYDLFFEEYYKRLPSQYVPHTYKTDKIFSKSHGFVSLKNSVLKTTADLYDNTVKSFGIFVDIMPLDICPVTIEEQKKHEHDYLRVKKLRKLKLTRIYKETGFLKICVKRLLHILFWPLSVRTINRWQERVMTRYRNCSDSPFWCSMASKYRYEKQLMNKNIYGTPKLVQFEDREYYMPEKADEYLTRLYGDYMRLPSEEEQEKMYNYFEVAEW